MARFDKIAVGFRAPLAVATPASGLGSVGRVTAVSINTSGQVVIGGPTADSIEGVICLDTAIAVGAPVDVMVIGEIVDCTTTDVTGLSAGDGIYAAGGATPSGQLTDVVTASAKVGKVLEGAASPGRGRIFINAGGRPGTGTLV